MKQWEIRTYAFPGAGGHPAVIVSHPLRVERKETVEVLLCTTLRAGHHPGPAKRQGELHPRTDCQGNDSGGD